MVVSVSKVVAGRKSVEQRKLQFNFILCASVREVEFMFRLAVGASARLQAHLTLLSVANERLTFTATCEVAGQEGRV